MQNYKKKVYIKTKTNYKKVKRYPGLVVSTLPTTIPKIYIVRTNVPNGKNPFN